MDAAGGGSGSEFSVRVERLGPPSNRAAIPSEVQRRNTVTPYGETVGPSPEVEGLLYFRNRYYDTETGRFLQRDPVWDAGNFGGQYSFAWNGPVSGGDPWGLQGWTTPDAFEKTPFAQDWKFMVERNSGLLGLGLPTQVAENLATAPETVRFPKTRLMTGLGKFTSKYGIETGGMIAKDCRGNLKLVNRKPGGKEGLEQLLDLKEGLTQVGTFHVHPDSGAEGAGKWSFFSAGDLQRFVSDKASTFEVVQWKKEQYMLLRTEGTPSGISAVGDADLIDLRAAALVKRAKVTFKSAYTFLVLEAAERSKVAVYKGTGGNLKRVRLKDQPGLAKLNKAFEALKAWELR